MLRRVVSLPASYPIFQERQERLLSRCPPVSLLARKPPPWAPGRLFLIFLTELCEECCPSARADSRPEPGMGNTTRDSLRKDTGGERRLILPHENRPKSDKTGENSDHFLLPFRSFSHRFPPPGHSRYPLRIGGVGRFPDEKVRTVHNGEFLLLLRVLSVLGLFYLRVRICSERKLHRFVKN